MKETKIKEFTLTETIGIGEESLVFRAKSSQNPNLAVKVTPVSERDIAVKDLFSEAKILSQMKNVRGFPKIHDCGIKNNIFFMAMDLLGPSLSDFLTFCSGRFTLQTILLLGFQMVGILGF